MLADPFLRSGKVRDLYGLSDGRILLVASDRISAFDVVLPTPIPDKGRILTGMSRFWFDRTASIVPNHLLETDVDAIDARDQIALERARGLDSGSSIADDLRGRIMICRPASVAPIEAVVRGYLAGSAWKEYREIGTVCGVRLPPGLRESDPLPEPIFTPAIKAAPGDHDENIGFDGMIDHLEGHWLPGPGGSMAERIREVSIRLYRHASAIADLAGIILADTKFEFGLPTDQADGSADGPGSAEDTLILIDEVLTPDSSRFWDAASYDPGHPQASFDKQFVRDWLEAQPWGKAAPGPELPRDIVEGTRARYVEAFERITGGRYERYLLEDVIAP